RQAFGVPLRKRRERSERGRHHAAESLFERRKIVAQKIVDVGRRTAVQIRTNEGRDLLKKIGTVAVRRRRAVRALDAANARQLRIDVIELVDDRVQLRQPGLRSQSAIELTFPRSIE